MEYTFIDYVVALLIGAGIGLVYGLLLFVASYWYMVFKYDL